MCELKGWSISNDGTSLYFEPEKEEKFDTYNNTGRLEDVELPYGYELWSFIEVENGHRAIFHSTI